MCDSRVDHEAPNQEQQAKKKRPAAISYGAFRIDSGGDLLSHTKSHAVPSALRSLTSEFGMGSGVASSQ